MSGDRDEMAKFEALAEAAYGAMYDAPPRGVKDFYDDARSHFTAAIAAAERAGLAADAARLAARRDHVTAVYNSQFRGVGF
ncbi:MAG: hypothetical protein ACREFC_15035 [Stellaceae bacterium]